MRELLLVRYGEIFLKGLNRPTFIRALIKRIKHAVKDLGGTVTMNDSRIFVTGYEDQDEVIRRVTKVFGVHSVCPAIEMDKADFEAVAAQAVKMMEGLQGTFKVSSRRSDKRYPLDSPTLNAQIGHRILVANKALSVDVKKPDHVLNVSLQPVRSQTMLFALEGDGVFVSAGSACAAHKQKVSGVLTAMGLSTAEADCALRFSLCPDMTEADIDYTIATIKKHYDMLKAFVRR